MQTVGVGVVLLCGQADKVVVCLAMLLLHKMHIIGGNQLDVVLAGKGNQLWVHLLLHLVGHAVGVGFVGLVALQLDVVVVAEHPFEP